MNWIKKKKQNSLMLQYYFRNIFECVTTKSASVSIKLKKLNNFCDNQEFFFYKQFDNSNYTLKHKSKSFFKVQYTQPVDYDKSIIFDSKKLLFFKTFRFLYFKEGQREHMQKFFRIKVSVQNIEITIKKLIFLKTNQNKYIGFKFFLTEEKVDPLDYILFKLSKRV